MKRIIMASITAVVVIAVLAGTLIPILDDATATSDTFTNEGYYYMQKITDTTPDITLSWDHTTPTKMTVGTETVDLPTSSTFPCSVIASDTWGLRWTSITSYVGMDLFGNANGTISSATTTNGYDMSITLSAGTATFIVNDVTYTQTYTQAYVISVENAEYSVMKGDESVYLNGDSEIYGTGRTAIAGGQKNINVSGNIDDGVTATVIYPSGWTASDYVINKTTVDSHLDLYKFDSVQFNVTDGETTATATYSQVIVPAEITAERAVHFTDGENAIFGAIPVIVIVALLLAIVAMVIRSRMD